MLHRNSEQKEKKVLSTASADAVGVLALLFFPLSPPRPALPALASAFAPAGLDSTTSAAAAACSSASASSCCCCCSRFRLERGSTRGCRRRRRFSSSRCSRLGRRPLGAARRLRRDQPRREPLDALDVRELVRGELEALLRVFFFWGGGEEPRESNGRG